MAEHLEAKETDIFLRSLWRPKQSQKESEYWTNISQAATNMTK